MSELAILGAGDLGGALAHRAASRDRFERVWLIDSQAAVASGKALDILQSGPVEGVTTRITGASVGEIAHADVLVVADRFGAPAQEWDGDEGLAALVEAAAVASRAVIVCAGARQRALVGRAVAEGGIARHRVLGSAPEAFGGAVRAAVALTLDCSALDLRVAVTGALPERPVVLWTSATAGASPLGARLTPSDRARIGSMIPFLWPPGPYALASAACRVAEAIATSARGELLVWAHLDGELGVTGEVMAVPARVSARGIDRISEGAFSGAERDELVRSAAAPQTAGR
jgi:malate dehydrogenase